MRERLYGIFFEPLRDMQEEERYLFGELVKTYFGEECTELSQQLVRGEFDNVNRRFFDNFKRIYNIGTRDHAELLYGNAINSALKIPTSIAGDCIPPPLISVGGILDTTDYERLFENDSRIMHVAYSPAHLINLFFQESSKPSVDRDPKLMFEVQRTFIAAAIVMLYESSINNELRDWKRRIFFEINQVLFRSGESVSPRESLEVQTLHDRVDNKFMRLMHIRRKGVHNDFLLRDSAMPSPEHHRIFQEADMFRFCPELGCYLRFRERDKDLSRVVAKMIQKSKSGKPMNPIELTDVFGFGYDILHNGKFEDEDKIRAKLVKILFDILGSRDFANEIVWHDDSGDTSQNSIDKPGLKQTLFLSSDPQKRFEVQFLVMKEWLDGKWRVGKKGERNRSHRLYEVERAAEVLQVLFPISIYPELYYTFHILDRIKRRRDYEEALLLNGR